MRRIQSLMTFAAVVLVLGACGEAAEPVATVTFEPNPMVLPYPGYLAAHLQWEVTAPLGPSESNPLVFVHILDEEGNVVRTFDHPLPFDWQPGTSHDYEVILYQSALAPPLDNGEYRLSLGLYDPSGQRWALCCLGDEIDDFEYQAATVSVNGKADEVPMFYFSPSWLPLEAGTDVQVLGRRWLTDEGSIRIAEIPSQGSVWMRLRLPNPATEVEELALMEGEAEPLVRVGGTCSAEEFPVGGRGFHEIKVPVDVNEEGEIPTECEILLQPNFYILEVDTLDRRSLALEILSWSGASGL